MNLHIRTHTTTRTTPKALLLGLSLTTGLMLYGCNNTEPGGSTSATSHPASSQPTSAPARTEASQAAKLSASPQLTREYMATDALAGPVVMMESEEMGYGVVLPIQPGAGENYQTIATNPFKQVSDQPVSTFSVDVDSASYANVRRFLNHGSLPPQDAVRVEEMVNYFSYNYSAPETVETPFLVHHELAPSPWHDGRHLMKIGIKGYEVPNNTDIASNLVFLIDVSGSMRSDDKIGLLKRSLKLLVKQMDENDQIAIAVYAGAAGLVLESTPGDEKSKIIRAIDNLQAGGSTNGAAGIELAYNVAADNFIEDGINRVILATDGDFNVGLSGTDELKRYIERKRKTDISLSVLGFGTGNYNDHLMEELSNHGNGNAAYIDSLKEAHKVLVEEMNSTLLTIAKDVKIQIEFNPSQVASYRLIGYENRLLNREDFNNDKIDAGDIGAGHTVTALYELVLNDSDNPVVDPLRYQSNVSNGETSSNASSELATLKLRYKLPDEDHSNKLVFHVNKSDIQRSLAKSSVDFRFATAVAGFGQLLRNGEHLNTTHYDDILDLAKGARGQDPYGYRGEFIQLVELASALDQ